LDKLSTALEVPIVEFFKFNNLEIDNNDLDKKALIDMLNSLLSERDRREVKLILRIANDIFKTMK
jgi:hypothetical protein